jgi:hypothetical protein
VLNLKGKSIYIFRGFIICVRIPLPAMPAQPISLAYHTNVSSCLEAVELYNQFIGLENFHRFDRR